MPIRRLALVSLTLLAAVAVAALLQPSTQAKPGHFSADDLSFDYPVEWRIIESDTDVRHYTRIVAVLGTGDWNESCQTHGPTGQSLGGVSCGPYRWSVARGQVVVMLSTNDFPQPSEATAPPGAIRLSNGLVATVDDFPERTVWEIYMSGWNRPLTVEARFLDPGAEDARAAVRRLVEGMVIAQDAVPMSPGIPQASSP